MFSNWVIHMMFAGYVPIFLLNTLPTADGTILRSNSQIGKQLQQHSCVKIDDSGIFGKPPVFCISKVGISVLLYEKDQQIIQNP